MTTSFWIMISQLSFITNTQKQYAVSESGISISIGSDTHWIGDFDKKRLVQANELARRLTNPIALGIN